MKACHIGNQAGLFFTRVSIGLYLTLAGWGKVTTEIREGFGTFYNGQGYTDMTPSWLPGWFAMPYGYALPWLEVFVGGLIVLGFLTRFASSGAFLMLASFTTAQIVATNSITGIGDGPGPPFTSNYILSAVFFWLIFTGAGVLSVDKLLFGKKSKSSD